ncbi:conserved hypothetical protein [Verrucomicrobia bacterium]|nr:conserved hypothetical protein [Verrucomicrobiota bacterium]
MELALYCPVYGYYEKEEDSIGTRGDYYTSVSVGNLFGELLAFQFARWLVESPLSGQWQGLSQDRHPLPDGQSAGQGPTSASGGLVQLAEAGAHRGQLAKDILGWLREQRPELFARLEYWIIEPSSRRRAWQKATLSEFADRVRWAGRLSELAWAGVSSPASARPPGICGIIFANELLDALPVHRLGWDAKDRSWFEWGVSCHGERFVWTRLQHGRPPTCLTLAGLGMPADLLEVLPDNFTVEVCPAARQWWLEAAQSLACGKLLTFDYGLSAEEFFLPHRHEGTLRAYYRHQLHQAVLELPGEQDITASVDFTALREAGESAGLHTEAFDRQGPFLTRVAAPVLESNPAWSTERTRQFHTLTHPDLLGHAFRALVQSRGTALTTLEAPAVRS